MEKNMLNKKLASLSKIEKYIESTQYSKALLCFSEKINELLSTPNIKDVYKVIARIPKTYFKTAEHKLLYGWLCVEVNNIKGLKWVLAELNFSKMKSSRSRASFLALSSMSLGLSRPEKGLYLTQRSLTYFEEGDNSIARANVYMNYAKQLHACYLFCMASQNYYEAAKIFEAQNCDYYAIACYVHSALNKCYAGKYDEVEQECYELLANDASKDNIQWKVLKLPIAISHYYKNDLDKCLELLLEVKKAIRKVPIAWFHVLLIKFMLNVHLNQNNINEVNDILYMLKTNKMYQQMSDMKKLIAAAIIERDIRFSGNVSKEALKVLGDILNSTKLKAPFFVVESLFRLKLLGKINGLKIDYINSYFSRARDIGNASNVQSMALFLADIYFNKGDNEKAKSHLEIAHKVYTETGSVINFYSRKLYSIELLAEIDEEFYNLVLINNKYLN